LVRQGQLNTSNPNDSTKENRSFILKTMLKEYSELDKLTANTLRMLAADAVHQANSGHPGLPLGAADISTVLWTRCMVHNPLDPQWPNRDRFVLSAGHGSALLYALLHLSGYPLSLEELKRFRQWGSLTPGHPEYHPHLGIEMTTGPLGQGISTAVGMALAERMLAARFNRPGFPIVEHYTYVLASDGDLMEGISHEAASLAGHLGLNRLIVLYDDNGISIDGPTALSFSEDVLKRFEAYHWHTQRVDGHDMAAIEAAIQAAHFESDRPSIIACQTHIGFGSPLQDSSKVHGAPLGAEDMLLTREKLGLAQEDSFFIPQEVYDQFKAAQGRNASRQEDWQCLLKLYKQTHPELSNSYEAFLRGDLPVDLESLLPSFPTEKPLATRVASGKVLSALAPQLSTLVGGSADLTPSNNTKPADGVGVKKGDYSGSYIYFGVREHGMGAILNGLALHGMRAYGGTFLVFSDYMRPAIRLAALMGLPVVYVFTHDSIGLGEDGPTHQPVEHLTALRTIPNLVVIRPADANETAAAWKVALVRKDGPTALILSRQNLPVLPIVEGGVSKGAYIAADPPDGSPDLLLLASGSEVSLALDVKEALASEGVAARVVSFPSWELFDQQPKEYRNSVLLPGVPRAAIEAGVTLAWARYLCSDSCRHITIGLDTYGASAPYKTLFEKFGFTVENIANKAKSMLEA
jgi:transketolase